MPNLWLTDIPPKIQCHRCSERKGKSEFPAQPEIEALSPRGGGNFKFPPASELDINILGQCSECCQIYCRQCNPLTKQIRGTFALYPEGVCQPYLVYYVCRDCLLKQGTNKSAPPLQGIPPPFRYLP